MRAAVLPKFGDPNVFEVADVPAPQPAPDQMLVKVSACGVCGHDLLNRAGHFPHTQLPAVMGHEIAGVVVEAGPLVRQFKVGDRVAVIQRIPCGVCQACRSGQESICVSGPGFYGEGISGGYGEYVIASDRNAVLLPDSIPLHIGSVLSCAIGTGYHALRRGEFKLGDTVVITGASGGVGIHAVKLAALMGLRVIAISASPGKQDRLLDAGASDVVVTSDYNFHGEVRELTQGKGVDGVLEIAGARTFPSSVRSMRAGGRMVVVGTMEPGNLPFNPAMAVLKELEFIGSAHATLTDLRRVIELVAAGRIAPEIGKTMPSSEAAEAHRAMEAREIVGRVILTHDNVAA